MPKQLTVTSASEYDRILYGRMTPAMAAAYLREGQLPMRTFSEALQQMYAGEDLLMRLTDFFLSDSPHSTPQSVLKKVKNWVSGKNQPANRKDIFRIAFALGFNEAQLDYLLSLCTDYGIQYRDGHDAVFAWFLRNGYGYSDAKAFYQSLPPAPGLNQVSAPEFSRLTSEIRSEFLMIPSVEELRECYLRNLHRFGSLHLRAYYYFDKFISLLIHPAPSWIDIPEPYYSLETVMNTYLSLHMPSGKKREGYTVVQRLIKQNWPNATAIKNIRSHKEDVPRKLLLLLYVITEDPSVIRGLGQAEDTTELTLEDRMEEHWWTLNAMLGDCGMAQLDPRNATDWLILYAICAEEDEPMSDRLEQVISLMYESAGNTE